ncbi:hypothetical protein ACF0H5_015282 [Mactra antiquata]
MAMKWSIARLKTVWEKGYITRKLLLIFGIVVLLYIGRTGKYILSEFYYCSNTYLTIDPCTNCYHRVNNLSTSRTIPKVIHQIFFYETSDTLPKKLSAGKDSWLQRHPDYSYILWNKTSVDQLIHKEFPFLYHLYNSYGHWVRKADVARYVVLYQYGGWYIDMDVVCKHSLKPLEDEAVHLNKSIIVRETEPVGFSNDFIGITPKHTFLYTVLTALDKSNRWFVFPYANTMLATGPLFLWGRYLNYNEKASFYIIKNATYSKYLQLLHNSSWHSWDGLIIWYFFKDRKSLAILIVSVTFIVTLGIFYYKHRKKSIPELWFLVKQTCSRICLISVNRGSASR